MEPNEKEKPTDWKEIKLYTKLMLTFVVVVMTPLLIFNYSRSTYKPIKILIAIAGAMIIVFSIILVLTILDINKLENETNETESSKTENSKTKNEDFAKEKDESTEKAAIFCFPQKRKGTIQVVPYYDHLIRDKGKTTSRVTPFPTKQETPKRVNKESMREFIENHIQRMGDLDYIFAEISKNKYPITPELKSFLKNGYTNKNLRKDFDDYIRNNPPKGFAPETFDLTKNINQPTEAPKANPILTDLINQIQTHSNNIVVKQQGQQLTIKANLNKDNQNKNNQWGDF